MVNMKALPNRVIILGTARMQRSQQGEDEDETATVAEVVVVGRKARMPCPTSVLMLFTVSTCGRDAPSCARRLLPGPRWRREGFRVELAS